MQAFTIIVSFMAGLIAGIAIVHYGVVSKLKSMEAKGDAFFMGIGRRMESVERALLNKK